MRDTHTHTEAETQAEGEAGSMQEPDVGLDPGSPGSHPGLKAGAKLLSHPGIPVSGFMQGARCRPGLHLGTPGSCPRPKAGTKLLSHPGIPICSFFKRIFVDLAFHSFG